MKKLKYLLFATPLLLVACIRPPVPDVEQAIQNADPNTVIPLGNDESTDFYYSTALPVVLSSTRGLILDAINNRADVEQVEMSLMRLATEFFDPNDYFFREGQYLTREFIGNVLQPFDPDDEPAADASVEHSAGLNPPLGSSHTYYGDDTPVESTEENPVEHLIYVLEQNFVSIHEDEQGEAHIQLEGVAIGLALNRYHWLRDRTIGFEQELYMSEEEIVAIGQEIAAELLPLLRQQEGLEDVPIIIGLFVLQSYRETIPGGFASIAYIERGRVINDWEPVYEKHFRLPDSGGGLNAYDVNINDEFIAFDNTIENYFRRHGLVARAHVVNEEIYRVTMTFNMSFLGLAEKISFHQLLEQEVMNFSPQYDIRIIVRSPDAQHGAVTRPPGGEATVTRISW